MNSLTETQGFEEWLKNDIYSFGSNNYLIKTLTNYSQQLYIQAYDQEKEEEPKTTTY